MVDVYSQLYTFVTVVISSDQHKTQESEEEEKKKKIIIDVSRPSRTKWKLRFAAVR